MERSVAQGERGSEELTASLCRVLEAIQKLPGVTSPQVTSPPSIPTPQAGIPVYPTAPLPRGPTWPAHSRRTWEFPPDGSHTVTLECGSCVTGIISAPLGNPQKQAPSTRPQAGRGLWRLAELHSQVAGVSGLALRPRCMPPFR